MSAAFLVVVSFTLSVLLAVPSVIEAQEGQATQSISRSREDPALKGITVTESQKAQIAQIRAKYRAKKKEHILAVLNADSRSGKQDTKGTKPKSPGSIDLTELQTQQTAEIRALLSVDQRTLFDQNVAEVKEQIRLERERAKTQQQTQQNR